MPSLVSALVAGSLYPVLYLLTLFNATQAPSHVHADEATPKARTKKPKPPDAAPWMNVSASSTHHCVCEQLQPVNASIIQMMRRHPWNPVSGASVKSQTGSPKIARPSPSSSCPCHRLLQPPLPLLTLLFDCSTKILFYEIRRTDCPQQTCRALRHL